MTASVLEAVERHIPELLPYASVSRTAGTAIYTVRGVFAAVTGFGASRGPARTTLLLPGRPRSADIAAVVDVIGYLDDMSMGGEADRVAEDFTRLEAGRSEARAPHTQPIQV